MIDSNVGFRIQVVSYSSCHGPSRLVVSMKHWSKHIKANRLTRYTPNWSDAITQFHKNHHDIQKKTVLVYAEGLDIEQDFRTFGTLGQTQILVWSGIEFEIFIKNKPI